MLVEVRFFFTEGYAGKLSYFRIIIFEYQEFISLNRILTPAPTWHEKNTKKNISSLLVETGHIFLFHFEFFPIHLHVNTVVVGFTHIKKIGFLCFFFIILFRIIITFELNSVAFWTPSSLVVFFLNSREHFSLI
jgi:hypothetical protein